MTPLPTIERRRVQAAEPGWPPVPRQGTCVHPRCGHGSEQRHHAVARGVLFGPYDYIYIDDERVVNVLDLCMRHHDMLESKPGGCRSRLRWAEFGWAWYDRAEEDGTTRIYWRDAKTDTLWALQGFVKGDYRCL